MAINLNEPPTTVVEFRKTVMSRIEAEHTPLARAAKMLELYDEEYQLWVEAFPERKAEIEKLIRKSFNKNPSLN